MHFCYFLSKSNNASLRLVDTALLESLFGERAHFNSGWPETYYVAHVCLKPLRFASVPCFCHSDIGFLPWDFIPDDRHGIVSAKTNAELMFSV